MPRGLLPALLVLAFHPARWLAGTWFDPGYASEGEVLFVLVLALFAWSASSSETAPATARERRVALAVVLATAIVRAAGELFAVRTIGALALVADVYAAALALGVHRRARAASPAGLAALFALSLPVERILQRSLGYPLQLASARAACAALAPFHSGLACEGTRIGIEGRALSIDLPCSGARGLVMLTALLLALVAMRRLRGAGQIASGALLVVAGALAANTLRLVLLAEGLLRASSLPFDVLSEPAHSIAGILPLLLAALPPLALARRRRSPAPEPCPMASRTAGEPIVLGKPACIAAFAAALLITAIPGRPVDVSGTVEPIALPLSIGGLHGEPAALSEQEESYFTKYGGQAAKTRYRHGDEVHTAVVVRTRAPIRHLHAPDECLIGAGHSVRLEGVRGIDATAVYRSVAPDGSAWRVEVTYVAEGGARATSPAEVAWRWLRSPGASWTMVQRISPWAACDADRTACAAFDRSLFRALDVPVQYANPREKENLT